MKKIFLFMILGVFLISLTSAYFPDTHYYENKMTIAEPISSEFYQSCANNPDHCYSGNILSDVSVIFYYTSFQKYAVTHSPAFCEQMLDQANGPIENACAVGACLHQTQDLHSHNEMVPHSIRVSLLPNSFIHPPAEQHLDSIVNKENPGIHLERLQATDVFEDCVPLFKKVMSENDEYRGENLDAIFDKFVVELEGSETGYNPSFDNIKALPGLVVFGYVSFMLLFTTLTFLIIFKRLRYKDRRTWVNWVTFVLVGFISAILIFLFIANLFGQAFNAYTFLIRPISNLVPIGGHGTEVGIQEGRRFLAEGFSVIQGTDASGGIALREADKSIVVFQYILYTVIFGLFALLIWANFRPQRNKKLNFLG